MTSIPLKIYLTGADSYNWALAEDYQQTKQASSNFTHVNNVTDADIIHSVYWESLETIGTAKLKNKKVICNLSGAWERYERDFHDRFLAVADNVDLWVARSLSAQKTLVEMGRPCFFIPYTVNTEVFKPLSSKKKDDNYIIGNFMRDTQSGKERAPKMVKGPDIFADIVTELHRDNLPIHVLLAGPRRHWMRKILKERGIPFTYIGYRLPFDDMRINTLSRKRLNKLYNMLNLSLVSSRSEAGPHAILEAGASKTPQISTSVGIAPDVLPARNVYDTVEQAVQLIKQDIESGILKQDVETIYEKVKEFYTPEVASHYYQNLYEQGR